MSKVVLFGTGPFAEIAHFLLENDSDHTVVGFTVHDAYRKESTFRGLPLISFESLEEKFPPSEVSLYTAIGYKNVNQLRATVYAEAKARSYSFITYVSSKCTNWCQNIGENTFIFEDNTLQPFTRIGNNVVLWSGNHIGHHSVIEDHCYITSHVVISGQVHIGAYTFIGVNATLRDSITVGKLNVIGAGALIMRSTQDHEVYVPERTKVFPKTSDQINL